MKQWIVLFALAQACCFAAMDSALLRARDAQDRVALDKLVAATQTAAEKAPKSADAQYRFAVASSALAEVALEQKDKAAAAKTAVPGIKAAEAAIALNQNSAEYHRILAALCGQAIPGDKYAAFSYGKRAKDAIEKAKQLDPKSAQVWIADGVGNSYLPAFLGGGPDPAIRSFEHALELDPKSSEAWLWLGIQQRKKQQNAEARKSFEKALALDPNRLWAKQQLAKTPAT